MWSKRLLVLAIVLPSLFGAHYARREGMLQQMASSEAVSGRRAGPFNSLEGRASWERRNRHFADLWMARQRRDVVSAVVPFLEDPYYGMRKRAVRALGRLEKPVAKPRLQRFLRRVEGGKEPDVPAQLVRWAVGRIDARGLKGGAKLRAVARSTGLSWNEMVRLSRKVYNPPTRRDAYAVQGSVGQELMQEVVVLLYDMARRGDDIRPFRAQLVLPRVYEVYLQGAQRNAQQEIQQLLDYSTQEVKIIRAEEQWVCEDHLVSLGRPASDAIEKRLRHMLASPGLYRDPAGYGTRHVMIFRAAAKTREQRFINLLLQFEKVPLSGDGKWIRGDAHRARSALQQKASFPLFPA